ncbi:MAG TPA: AMP-binding protein, partial [Chloroflexia bacterium]|nr:AMP-binding protein [Chloroflexia bacterium]
METVSEVLEQAVRQHGSRPALLYHPGAVTEIWSYTQLGQRADRVAAALRARGIVKGDRVVLWGANSPWWVASYFGAVQVGAILVPLDVRSTADFVERAVRQTAPRLALLGAATRNLWSYPIPSVLMEDFATEPAPAPLGAAAVVGADDIVELMFTSGTTGDPKGVIITHRNILANLESSTPLVPDMPEYRLVSILPLSHMLEQTIGLLLALKRGASIYYLSGMQPATLFATFKEQRPTTLLLVPQVLHLLMDGIEREVQKQGRTQLWARLQALAAYLPLRARRLLFRPVLQRLGGQIAFLTSGGAPLAPEMIHKWELLGIPIVQGYGTTEASPVVSATSLREHLPTSVGKAVAGVQIRIAADGEVLLRGANITAGYWQNAELTRQAFDDGWYKTGDLGRLDAEGHLYLQGRKKDMIVLANGENVFPEDVEAVLRAIPGVLDAAVLGLPTPQGAAVHAALLLASSTIDPAAVVRQANARLAPRQRIQGQTVWPEPDFPRTFTLKVKKHDVLSGILAARARGPAAAPAPAGPRSREAEVIARIAAAASVAPAALTPDTRLSDIAGLDSLAQVELLAALDAIGGSRIDESQIGAETTVAMLAALLDGPALGATALVPPPATSRLQAG